MKVLVTGSLGQLGHDCVNELIKRKHIVTETDVSMLHNSSETITQYIQMDITDMKSVYSIVEAVNPEAIIHCAAWTDVDAAEDKLNKESVNMINVNGTVNIAKAAKSINAKMIYISTDYVFDGQGIQPWQPNEKHYAPLNYYGQTKLEGELSVSQILKRFFIVRTSWMFGTKGHNFVNAILRAGRTQDTVKVVNDQIGLPTYSCDLARLLADMIETEKYGYYHATNQGEYISWYDFACEISKQAGIETEIMPVTTEEYGLNAAARPRNSRLDGSKLACNGFTPLPDWKCAVSRYLKEAVI